MMKNTWSTKRIAFCGILAAIYAVITVVSAPIAYGPVQFRLSEALCVLPFFAPYTTAGLFLGCLVANLFSTVSALDIVVGSLATLLGCLWTSKLKKIWLTPVPTVVCNAVLVGLMLAYVYTPDNFLSGFALMGAQVGLGELVVMVVLGLPLAYLIRRNGWDEKMRSL
ncbi:MAG: QueT transporter family protein [Oscillospiraceae bacterium]|nr:QueT transporter family protein [Oscillospiraceae bacterium]